MTTEQDTPSATDDAAGGRIDNFLDRWRTGWQDHDSVLPRPTVEYQGIDWADVQDAHDEAHAGRV